MLTSHEDITDRLGEPLWYDDHGCPRYAPFNPKLATVYGSHVALIEIGCQGCTRHFIVASVFEPHSWEEILGASLDQKEGKEVDFPRKPHLPTLETGIGEFHYGDPPGHDYPDAEPDAKGWDRYCVGNTMNSIPLRVLEFWVRTATGIPRPIWDGCGGSNTKLSGPMRTADGQVFPRIWSRQANDA